jgi:hypothetical protein
MSTPILRLFLCLGLSHHSARQSIDRFRICTFGCYYSWRRVSVQYRHLHVGRLWVHKILVNAARRPHAAVRQIRSRSQRHDLKWMSSIQWFNIIIKQAERTIDTISFTAFLWRCELEWQTIHELYESFAFFRVKNVLCGCMSKRCMSILSSYEHL